MKRTLSVLAASTAMLAATPALAQFAKPEHAVEYRQGAMFVLGQHFSRLGAMANGKVPFDAKAAAENAAVVEFMSRLPWPAFAEGTDQGKTQAKPEIWKENDKFRAAATKMQDEVTKLVAAARSGSLEQLKASFGPAAQSCKSCHDHYREK
ncbi:cytochrome c [Aquabacterium sp. A7-Y]|uniref:c-type cytochrome n=1 Tax=Aquabacterium sp. A7-Y TaxID=1349605 RepID=UPI00223D96A7|nr:cytochrome c [Aquabacterium sp. A7-Y]MCW7539557.1 cytochrome c [Aquabacterium sp. A7-Y]